MPIAPNLGRLLALAPGVLLDMAPVPGAMPELDYKAAPYRNYIGRGGCRALPFLSYISCCFRIIWATGCATTGLLLVPDTDLLVIPGWLWDRWN